MKFIPYFKNFILGLHRSVVIKPEITSFMLSYIADYRDYNLLLVAAEVGNIYIVEIMLELGFSSEYRGMNAQTLAWKNRHFEVLLLLLKSNLIYPYSIYIDECPDDIQEFFEISRELNEAILVKDKDKVLRIISQNTEMIHFYNLNNESALAFALNRRLFDMYRLLISKNIMFGPHEKFSEIKEDMKESERKKLREIHFKESKYLPDNHINILLSNSRISHDTSNATTKFNCVKKAFEYLNSNPSVQIILKIVAASRNFRIIFDFKRDSVEVVDPTVDDSTEGLFYITFGRIYIGARKLLDSDTKFEVLGVLAHELCHNTMALVYNNFSKPYFKNDNKAKQTFEGVLRFCIENSGKEKIIDAVHTLYDPCHYHAELIVRVPHLIMHYMNKPEKFNAINNIFPNLFDIYEKKVLEDMKKALPKIEAKAESEKKKSEKKIRKLKIILLITFLVGISIGWIALHYYKPTYKFSLLSPRDKIKVENAPVIYCNVDIVFRDLFPHNASAYNLLTSDDISQMLSGNPLNFSNPHLSYLKDLIVFEWKNLTTKLKDKFLSSNFTFQNKFVTFKNMNISNSDVFKSLQSKQIIFVLDGNSLVVHKMIQNKTAFYTERSMFMEYIYPIYYLFMNKLNGDKTQLDCIYTNTSGTANDTFKNFYHEFENLNFKEIISKTNQITYLDDYSTCFVSGFKILDPKTRKTVDSLLSHKSLQKGYKDILKISGIKPKTNASRIFMLSADAGTGKTVTFMQFAIRIKRKYPTRWVSYINYRKHKEYFERKIETLDNARTALAEILKIKIKNQFEKRMFEELFATGRMILFWDGYDQICPDWLENSQSPASKIIELINNHTKNIQFVSTRPSHSDKLRTTFKIEPYTFVPLNNASKNEFLRGFFISRKFNETQIPTYINKVQNIVRSTKSKNDFNTPLPLEMIALIISTEKKIYNSENLFQIYEKVVKNKLLTWLNQTNGQSKLIESLLVNGISINEIFQKYALRLIPNNNIRSFDRYLSLKLEITTNMFPNNIKINQISEMGILYINSKKSYSFAHSTFIEYFIAQYLIQNVFKTKDDVYEQEAELRIQLFYWSIQDSGISVFIESYLETVAKDTLLSFNPQILNLFLTKYNNFMINMMQSRTPPIPLLMEFFKKNHMLLIHQLRINQSESIYASTFDYAHFNFYSHDNINRSEIINAASHSLTKDEYEQFISLKNYKGIILYSMYCVKQFHNSSEYARKTTPDYDLPDEIFNNDNVSEVLTSIAQNLTSKELKILLTSKTVWYRLYIYNGMLYQIEDNNLEFYKTLMDLIEINLTSTERKHWIYSIFKFPFLLKDEETRDFLLSKFNESLLNATILDHFLKLHVLHYTATIGNTDSANNFSRFNYSWNYLLLHTNKTERRQILKRLENVECFLDHKFTNFCYLVPKIYLLQASLTENLGCNGCNSSKSFHEMIKIYESHFNKTELQELILTGSKDFIPFLIIVRSLEDCKAYAKFLKELFKDNKLSLKKFLLEPIEPTLLNIFGLFSSINYSEKKYDIFKKLSRI